MALLICASCEQPHEHTPVDVAEVPSTCTVPGTAAGVKCAECGEVFSGCEALPLAEHTPISAGAVPPTCIATGVTAGTRCEVCDKILDDTSQIIPMIDHEIVDSVCVSCGRYFITADNDVFVQALKTDGAYIILQNDIEITAKHYFGSITFDLNGHKIYCTSSTSASSIAYFEQYKDRDASLFFNGSIEVEHKGANAKIAGSYAIKTQGNITLDNLNIKVNGLGVVANTPGVVNIKNCNIETTCTENHHRACLYSNNSAVGSTYNLENSTFKSPVATLNLNDNDTYNKYDNDGNVILGTDGKPKSYSTALKDGNVTFWSTVNVKNCTFETGLASGNIALRQTIINLDKDSTFIGNNIVYYNTNKTTADQHEIPAGVVLKETTSTNPMP